VEKCGLACQRDARQVRAEAWLRKLASDPARVRLRKGWVWLLPQIHTASELPMHHEFTNEFGAHRYDTA
jgi:hypothetical protein